MEYLCYLCLVFVLLSRLFIAALWSPAGKGLTSGLLFVMSNCDFVTFPGGIMGQLWCFIVLIPDLSSTSTRVYRHWVYCEYNYYSCTLIFLKLQVFCQDLKMCVTFRCNPHNYFLSPFCSLNLVNFGSSPTILPIYF